MMAKATSISDLPDCLLHHILSFMPAKDAAKLSMLSQRWRYLWAESPAMDFDQRSFRSHDSDDSFPEFMDRVMFAFLSRRRHSDLKTLRLLIEGQKSPKIDGCLRFSMETEVQELHLDCAMTYTCCCPHRDDYDDSAHVRDGFYSDSYTLPKSLFINSNSNLRVLSLKNCTLVLPSKAISLGRLHTLELSRVGAEAQTIEKIISSCPLITKLVLVNCRMEGIIRIFCPTLEFLTLNCCHLLERIEITGKRLVSFQYMGSLPANPSFFQIKLPCLARAELNFCEWLDGDNDSGVARLRDFIGRFDHAKCLSLSSKTIEGLTTVKKLWKAPSSSLLSRLEIEGRMNNSRAIFAVAGLLNSTPHLAELSLSFITSTDDQRANEDSEGTEYIDLQNVTINCLQKHLKVIKIFKFEGHPVQSTMAKFLLKNARVLKQMYVQGADAPIAHHRKMQEKLISWRSNSLVEVLYT